jgi:hypothetical protein
MTKFQYEEEPIFVCRDGGYPIAELLTPENRKKALDRVKDPNYVNSKHFLKEFWAKRGIIVNPNTMSYVHIHDYM